MSIDTKIGFENLATHGKYQLLEARLKKLICAYLEVVNSVDDESAISISKFFVFYGKLYWGYLNFFVLPIVILIDVLILILNRFKTRKIRYVRGVFINYGLAAFRALHGGDAPILKFVTLRYFTRLFVSYHIKKRLRSISTFLQSEEIKVLFGPEAETENLQQIRNNTENLSKLDNILSKSVELKIFLTVASFWGVVTWTLKFLGLDISQASINSLLDKRHTSSESSPFLEPLLIIAISLGFTIIFGAIFGLISSFARKRELMQAHNIYELERSFFSTERIPHPREFPLDLTGWSAGWTLFLLPLLLDKATDDGSKTTSAILLLFGLACFLYALLRRIKLGKY